DGVQCVVCLGVVAIELFFFFFFQAEDGIRDRTVTGVQTCASDLTISVFGQPPDRDLIRRYLDAGAARVIVRPESMKTDAAMAAQIGRASCRARGGAWAVGGGVGEGWRR